MVNNSYYICNICGCHIRLRYQLGYFDIPINIYCPECHSHISGIIVIENNSFSENLKNATITNEFSDGYKIELSTEFITDKFKKNNGIIPELSPFMRSNPFDTKRIEQRNRVMNIAINAHEYVQVIRNVYNLLKNNKTDLLINYLDKHNNSFINYFKKNYNFSDIKNKLDALMTTKHYVTSFLQSTIITSVSNKINAIITEITEIYKQNNKGFNYFLKYLEKADYFDFYYDKIPNYICKYLNELYQLIPLYDVYSIYEEVDQTNSGITTISIESMHSLYSKGYELLCDSIDILFGLHNIKNNTEYDDFGAGRESFSKKMTSYGSKFNKYKALSSIDSCFTNNILGTLDNIIRNSDAHNNFKIDGLSQSVTFLDKHKEKSKSREMSFLDFGKKCMDLYFAIIIVWEYYYQCLKLKLMFVDNNRPNITIYKDTF
ncbi:MAG: hypothetical protein J1F32_03030 [Erysipelotrichales bacterium]|nr:hypothetical protein [Erysipelotrichales bacterium]